MVAVIFAITVLLLVFSNSVFSKSKRYYKECSFVDELVNEEEIEVFNLINEQRRLNGLSELKLIYELQYVAEIKANDIVINSYFSHNSPMFGSPFELLVSNDIDYAFAGENLAGNSSPKNAVDAWMNSSSHRDNILDKNYQYTGIAAVDSPIYGRVYVQFFLGE